MSEGPFPGGPGPRPVRLPGTDPPSPPRGRKWPSLTAALGIALAFTPVLSACGGQDYCGSVEEHQAELTDLTASGSPAALLRALPIFGDLAEQAPDDIRDDWSTLLDPLQELDYALGDAGVDPAAYDPANLPADLTDDERRRIEAAGAALADPAVVAAFDAVQQQAKDVCHTPLSQ